jgi:type III secretion protein R
MRKRCAVADALMLGMDAGMAGRPVETLTLLAGLSLLPFVAVALTSFSKMSVVLSLLRTALGSQQAPPTMVLTGLAMVLSGHVMAPVISETLSRVESLPSMQGGAPRSWADVDPILAPLRGFLVKHGDPAERAQLLSVARELRGGAGPGEVGEMDLSIVVPAFVLTELREAFQLGFLVFLPFLVLDMVVSNVLLALGMQTLSPTQVSLPFKLLLFVAADGWSLLSRGLLLGYR